MWVVREQSSKLYSIYKVNSGKNLVNKTRCSMLNQQLVQQRSLDPGLEKLKHAVARFTDVIVGVTGKVWQYKMAFYNVHKSSMSVKLASNKVLWQSVVHLHSHKDYV